MLTSENSVKAKFAESQKGEVRKIPLPRTPVNKGKKGGRACQESTSMGSSHSGYNPGRGEPDPEDRGDPRPDVLDAWADPTMTGGCLAPVASVVLRLG